MPAIGILGGMGPQASAHLQTLLIKDAPKLINIKSDSDFPEIVMFSVSVPNFVSDTRNFQKAKEILKKRVELLEQAGCVVGGIACNTAHLMLPELQAVTSMPFLSIPKLVNKKLVQMGAKKVGLLASPNTIKSRLYDDEVDSEISLIRPSQEITDEVEQLIFRRLASSDTAPEDTARLHEIVAEFASKEELDLVILGCTELPLIFGDSADADSDNKVISSLGVLSEGLLKAWVESRGI